MTLSVIGAGFGRTGTNSIKKALEQLGLGPCHHMEEVFGNPSQLPHWELAANGQTVKWERVFEGYHSAIDWPSAHYWRELADYYPEAKVLLSVRPFERWWSSFTGTIMQVLEDRDAIADAHTRAVATMAYKIIAEDTFSGLMSDKATAQIAYEKRIDDVKQTIRADRLLIFDVSEGWSPLCSFFNLPEPQMEFPRSNSTADFKESFDRDSDAGEKPGNEI
jgi:hypothetical protein